MNGDAMSINQIKSTVYATAVWLNKLDTCIVMYHRTPLLYYMERVKKIILLPVTTTLEAYFCDSATSFIDCMSIAK